VKLSSRFIQLIFKIRVQLLSGIKATQFIKNDRYVALLIYEYIKIYRRAYTTQKRREERGETDRHLPPPLQCLTPTSPTSPTSLFHTTQ